jgi:hypothetical protein
MIQSMENLETTFDKVEYLQNLLIDRATGGSGDDSHYQVIRKEILNNPLYSNFVPRWIKVNRNLSQFWQFIKHEHDNYADRRRFIWDAFNPLLEYLESGQSLPPQKTITETLSNFDSENIHHAWAKALERKANDPEGAITISRTILESVCKHILDSKSVEYNASNIDLSELYKLTAKELNLAPEQHGERIFKQILGGCSGIVNGLGSLRNKLGDAHGQGRRPIKPQDRHAELAVNLAGTMALFLVSTYEENKA